MKDTGSLELAQARLGARWGRRADEALCRRIESARSFAAVLELAHGSGLAPWVEGLSATAPVHAIEQRLRQRFAEGVHELAGWMPAAWRTAVLWCAVIVELPLLHHLARGEPAPPWTTTDPAARRWLESALGATSPHAVAPRDGLHEARAELIARARRAPERLPDAWGAQWHRCAPPGAERDAIEARLGALWRAHGAALALPAADTRALRQALQAALVATWRRALLEPLAAFAYLALLLLEHERLRGELVGRAALPRRTPQA